MEDGKVLFAAGEERFTRVKLQNGFPVAARCRTALDRTGTSVDEIDVVSYPFLPWEDETRLFERNISNERAFLDEAADRRRRSELLREAAARVPNRARADPRPAHIRTRRWTRASPRRSPTACSASDRRGLAQHRQARFGRVGPRRPARFHRKWHEELESGLEELQLGGKLKRVDHHLSHAANAYYTSGFDDALIVTLDGYGSGLAGSVSIGRDGAIERLHGVEFPHSLGTFYESVTSGLGFQPSRHEGKIVGLAAYGDPAVLRDVLLARFRPGAGQLPDPREQQRLLRADAGEPVPEDRRRGRLSARARSSSPRPTCRTTCARTGHHATWCSPAASSPTSS